MVACFSVQGRTGISALHSQETHRYVSPEIKTEISPKQLKAGWIPEH